VFLVYLEERNIAPKKVEEIGTNSGEIAYVIASVVIVIGLLFVIYRMEHKKTEIAIQ